MPSIRRVRHTSTEKAFICSHGCGSAFARPSDLVRHHKSHLPRHEREFRCERVGCDFTANQRNGLICHIRSVHERVRVRCDYPGCTRDFSDPSCLSRHRRKHGVGPVETAKVVRDSDTGRGPESVVCDRPSTSARNREHKPDVANKAVTLHTQSPYLQHRVCLTSPSLADGNSNPAVSAQVPGEIPQVPFNGHPSGPYAASCSPQDNHNSFAPGHLPFVESHLHAPLVSAHVPPSFHPASPPSYFDATSIPSYNPFPSMPAMSSHVTNTFGSLPDQSLIYNNETYTNSVLETPQVLGGHDFASHYALWLPASSSETSIEPDLTFGGPVNTTSTDIPAPMPSFELPPTPYFADHVDPWYLMNWGGMADIAVPPLNWT